MRTSLTDIIGRFKNHLRLTRPQVIAVITATALAALIGGRPDVRIGDIFLTEFAGMQEADPPIVIVTIDEDTLAALPYRSPVDRAYLANLIATIDAADPRAIGIDILFDQPTEPAKDAALQKQLRATRAPLVVAYAGTSDGLTEAQAAYLTKATSGLIRGHVALERRTADGIVRHWPATAQEANAPSLFSRILAQRAGVKSPPIDGRIVVYNGPTRDHATFPVYPSRRIGILPKEWFHKKIVLIGGTLPGTDEHLTARSTARGAAAGTLYGVMIHAHMINQLLRSDAITSANRLVDLLLAAIAAAAAAAIVTLPAVSLARRLAAIAALAAVITILSLAAFSLAGIEFGTVTVSLAPLLAAAILAARQWSADRRQRRFVQQAFSQYVNPRVIEDLVADPGRLQLGGEQRTITCLFTDISGFTTLAEQRTPSELSHLLNSYLDGVCGLFIRHGATIDKIVGDGVIGFFGAPDAVPDQAERAIGLAIAVDRFSESFRRRNAADGIDLGHTRIGIHHGPAIVGNFGGSRFFDYTCIGDTVNTAARLEAANKHFGTRICVSAAVANAHPGANYRTIGEVVLSGKQQPIICLEALAPGSQVADDRAAYAKAYELMAAGDPAAVDAFDALAKRRPDDPLPAYHLNRLRGGATGTTILLSEK